MPTPPQSSRSPIAAIVLDGDPPSAGWGALLDEATVVIAVDGGGRHALREGVAVQHVVGDLDSLSSDDLAMLTARGAAVHRHPTDKDETDFELAATFAARLVRGDAVEVPRPQLVVVGGAGGRIDHTLGNIAVLCSARFAAFDVRAVMGDTLVQPVAPDRPAAFTGAVGSVVSLQAFGGTASGVTTTGLRYALDHAILTPTEARGTSNELVATMATITVDDGMLVVCRPASTRPLPPPNRSSR